MSDLGGLRASSGGVRPGGPVPVPSFTPIRTPRDVMRDRNAREARRQEEAQREEEQRRMAEERRWSADRRATSIPSAVPRFGQPSSQYTAEVPAAQPIVDASSDRHNSRLAGEVAGTNILGEPTGRASLPQEASATRARGYGATQAAQQARPTPALSGSTRRTQTSQAGPRQPAPVGTPGAVPASPSAPHDLLPAANIESSQRGNQSSFPHAFERWETLSSHWEGLTSYWLHKLEQNTELIRDNVPNASTLSRQITDLSAAGANLFHAVVELQRLRASSERKFQRWFFETRADNEKSREVQAGLERQLNLERQTREDAAREQAEAAITVENAKREVAEMRRELMISKDEARRAWEELGRRNQESLDTAQSLKEGRVTLVSGVQVVPYFGHLSRTGSASQTQLPPVARDGPQEYSSASFAGGATGPGLSSPRDEREFYRKDIASPTNTDPFIDSDRTRANPRDEHGKPSLTPGTPHYPPGNAPVLREATGSTPTHQQAPSQPRTAPPPSAANPEERFYQHGGQGIVLHSPQSSSQDVPAPAQVARAPEIRSEISYVGTASEGETEYVLDKDGSILHDEHGRPLVYRRREPARSSESEDDFDTDAAMRRERELAERYGSGILPEAPELPSTSAQAMASFTSTADQAQPDYEGAGFEDYQQQPAYPSSSRHHHPTRLSDVLEEEEERSSRRTTEL